MVCVWLVGRMFVRPVDGLSNLAVAALVILLWQPVQLFDGGFILSFTVVLALLMITPRIQKRLEALFGPDWLTPRPLWPRWRTVLERPLIWLIQLFSCSLAAWIGLLPLMAVYFHLFTPISILANVLVVPMLGIIIALGMASTAAHAVWPWLAATFNNANYCLLSTMIHGVAWLGRAPGGHQFVQAPPLWLVAAYYVLLALLLNTHLPRRRLTLGIVVPAFCVAVAVWHWPDNAVEITALDLHDGMAVFVNAPGEANDWLLDGGGDWSGERVVVPHLRSQGVDRLHTVLLTRGDKAHAAGLSAVIEKIGATRAAHGGTGSRSKFFWNWLGLVRERKLEIVTVREGDEWSVGPGIRVRVLNPPRDSLYTRSDDNAVVLLVESGTTRVLLTSDIGESVERRLLDSHVDLRAQVIIKGRHSEEASCTEEFLNAVKPEAVIQCASSLSLVRYPQPDLRDRLRQRGVAYYRTDETGAVTIHMTPQGYSIRTWIPQ
jgi:competence protein ComEC